MNLRNSMSAESAMIAIMAMIAMIARIAVIAMIVVVAIDSYGHEKLRTVVVFEICGMSGRPSPG